MNSSWHGLTKVFNPFAHESQGLHSVLTQDHALRMAVKKSHRYDRFNFFCNQCFVNLGAIRVPSNFQGLPINSNFQYKSAAVPLYHILCIKGKSFVSHSRGISLHERNKAHRWKDDSQRHLAVMPILGTSHEEDMTFERN